MVMRIGLIAATIVIAVANFSARNVSQGGTPAVASMTAYDDFMKLTVGQRRDRFHGLAAENKAMIFRTHAERWLAGNRGRLTASEIAMFEEIIAFITPGLYDRQPDGALDKREEALRAKMRCRVSPDDVMAAMNVLTRATDSRPPTPTWTYLSQAKCWLEWIAEGFMDYIPASRR
jgi:hypothetical protein